MCKPFAKILIWFFAIFAKIFAFKIKIPDIKVGKGKDKIPLDLFYYTAVTLKNQTVFLT